MDRREAPMTYELTLVIHEDSPEGRNIETLAEAERISREEAARKLLAGVPHAALSPASPAARRILGAFSAPEDAALMDEAVALAMQERERRNALPVP
jgi:hypothetical protein